MARLKVMVDGEERYYGNVPGVGQNLPAPMPTPATAPSPSEAAFIRTALLGSIGPMIAMGVERIPELKPVATTCRMTPERGGFVVEVSGPPLPDGPTAHVTISIDGVTKLDRNVPESYLPENGRDYPRALRGPDTPLSRLYLLELIGPQLADNVRAHPILAPIDATCETREDGSGFTLTVSGAAIDTNDVLQGLG